jgi:hypothetical protein
MTHIAGKHNFNLRATTQDLLYQPKVMLDEFQNFKMSTVLI